jgi:hypothetical protein
MFYIKVREHRRGNKIIDKSEKLATLGTQDTGQIQTNTNKNTSLYTKKLK